MINHTTTTDAGTLHRATRVIGARITDANAARLATVAAATGETPSTLLRRLLDVHLDAWEAAAYKLAA